MTRADDKLSMKYIWMSKLTEKSYIELQVLVEFKLKQSTGHGKIH